jgi:2-aminoethylphosphonate-pyruvate transaminase
MAFKKLLFTPGPLTTSPTVKQAAMEDVGSRDPLFIDSVKEIREELLDLAGVSTEGGYECVIIQGSGTFAIESVVSSVIRPGDVLLVIANGAYGERIAKMAEVHGITHEVLRFAEDEVVCPDVTERFLKDNPQITHVACIHCETTTGLFNPILEIGALCMEYNKIYLLDAMSSFGGVECNMREARVDFLISSSNKCIEGIPGFGFVLCNRTELERAQGNARSLSLDLYAQWQGLETNGQFRFTPPTLSIMAFRQALRELGMEGGIRARQSRYRENKKILDEGMAKLGFRHYLKSEIQGHIISSFIYPSDANFDFGRFYQKLNDRGFIIYPGKLTRANAFRIGNIGQIFPDDVRALIRAIDEVLIEENVTTV